MLTVPVHGEMGRRICDMEVMSGNWGRKMLRAIEIAYAKAPYRNFILESIEPFLRQWSNEPFLRLWSNGGNLAVLNAKMLALCFRLLGIEAEVLWASDLALQGQKSARVLDMCVKLGASDYIFGSKGRGYADVDAFRAEGITPHFQDYQYAPYPQQHGDFLPAMSILDVLMNCGPNSREVILRNNVSRETLCRTQATCH